MKENKEVDIEHFKIDGTIHGKAISKYIDEQIEVNKRKQRLYFVGLALFAIACFVWAAMSQYKLGVQKKDIIQTKKDKKSIALIKEELEISDQIMDSLENMVYKLKSENATFIQNTPTTTGVFFEVQIGSFENTNLAAYTKNLENIRLTKQGQQNLLLLGRFTSFKQALMFEKELKQLGIENAFVVGRIDNKVVSYQDALDAQNKNNK